MKTFSFLICLIIFSQLLTAQSQNPWETVANPDQIIKSSQLKTPAKKSLIKVTDYDAFYNDCKMAARWFSQASNQNELIISLPLPDGTLEKYSILESPIMEPELAAKFPEIKTYTGIGKTPPYSKIKIDFTSKGFHAMIYGTKNGSVFIDPYNIDEQVYMSYYKKDYPKDAGLFVCETEADVLDGISNLDRSSAGDCEFRQYRLALACTGEYATYHGGTINSVMAAFVTSMNRVNGVFELDAGLTMIMVANNDQLIFLNAGTDPYTNGSGSTMLGQNQTTCTNVIGSNNFDIGHVFSTGGGGVASLRSPCVTSRKARGVTGRGAPIGDPFDIDYVAHEMGHQYGGNHTQNNNCNRSNASYEPGSASTIMGYAGICSPNVQNNSDDYFHAVNIAEMGAFTTGSGNCAAILSTANTQPTAAAGNDYTVPISTPFELTGFGTDADDDPMTYCWEQYNNAVSTQPPSSTNSGGPNFRSFKGTENPVRVFPQNGGSNTTWEVLPSITRTMTFRLTVRDNNIEYGCTEEDDMQVQFSSVGGPFVVLSPNGGQTWDGLSSQSITWDVANTTAAPISSAQVDILLSDNGGLSYDHILASQVSNSGSATVAMPNITTTEALIKVKGYNNIFFDRSDNVFTINTVYLCSQDSINFNLGQIADGAYQANYLIRASVPVQQNANVILQSGGILCFENGFEVPIGAELEAKFGLCD